MHSFQQAHLFHICMYYLFWLYSQRFATVIGDFFFFLKRVIWTDKGHVKCADPVGQHDNASTLLVLRFFIDGISCSVSHSKCSLSVQRICMSPSQTLVLYAWPVQCTRAICLFPFPTKAPWFSSDCLLPNAMQFCSPLPAWKQTSFSQPSHTYLHFHP